MSLWMSSLFNRLFGKPNTVVSTSENILMQKEAKEIVERMTIRFFEGALVSRCGNDGNVTYMDKVDEVIRNIYKNEIQSTELMMYLVIGYALGSDMDIDEYCKKCNSFMEIVNNSGVSARKRQRRINKE